MNSVYWNLWMDLLFDRLTCLSRNQKRDNLLDSFFSPLPLSTQTYLKIEFLLFYVHDKMLTQACMQSEYYEKVIDAVRFYTRTAREGRTFETLVTLMYKRPISPQFQVKQTFPFHDVVLCGLSIDMLFFISSRHSVWLCSIPWLLSHQHLTRRFSISKNLKMQDLMWNVWRG